MEDHVKNIFQVRSSLRTFLSIFLFALITLALISFHADLSIWITKLDTHKLSPLPVLLFFVACGFAGLCLSRIFKAVRCCTLTHQENARFLAAAESSMDDFYIFDGVPDASGNIVDFRFSYINPNAERRLNTRRETLIGKVLTEERPFMITSGLIEKYRDVVRTGLPFTSEVFIDDDRIKATWINIQVIKLGNGIAITSRDVTERKRLIDHITYLAHYDQLTGVANRTLLYELLQQAILRAQCHNGKIGVFLLDIDHFKYINDSLGHADGDALLSSIAKRLLASVQPTDTVARIGGDEFVLLMPDITSPEDVLRCGKQIVRDVALPFVIGEREVTITISMGLSIYPDCGLAAKDLLKKADKAMYSVKENGRNSLHIFSDLARTNAEIPYSHVEEQRA